MIEFMTPYDIMAKFVDNIEKQRIRKNMTQADLYKKAGLSASGYGKFIKNKRASFENILKLFIALRLFDNLNGLLKQREIKSLEEIKNESKLPKRIVK